MIRARARRERKPDDSCDSRIIRLGAEDAIMAELMTKTRPIIDGFRDGTHLHVSDVIGKCLRQIALAKSLDMRPAVRRLRDSEALTFRQGSVIHDFVRDRLAENHPEVVFGKWRCVCGHTTVNPQAYSRLSTAAECARCGQRPSRYVELDIQDDEYGLVGSPDVLMYMERYKAIHVGEIKSMAGKSFAELARPLPDHVIQVVFYWHLMRRAGYTLTDKVSIFYVNKEYSYKNPYREFLLDAAAEESRLDPYIEELQRYNAYMRGDIDELPLRLCPRIDAPDAKNCPVRVSCFG